jgi:lysophospholipase L1-like esterase
MAKSWWSKFLSYCIALSVGESRIIHNQPILTLTKYPLRDTTHLDPTDQSWVQNWAAIGDSYAAGLGVGERVDYGCSRYSGGFPNLINLDQRFGTNSNRTLQYLACSGLKSSEILAKQVPHLEPEQDIIIVSAGGNDVSLGDVLDACIFQFRHGSTERCEAALQHSQQLIDDTLSPNLEDLLAALTTKLRSDGLGRIYYPGYAQFFGQATSCNNVSWTVWPHMPPQDKQNLTLARRAIMNGMVTQVNQKIREAALNAGDHVVFVDWDWTFARANGRFCEDGSEVEPAPNRDGLLFYEWNTLDDGEDPWLIERPGDPVPSDSFEGDIGKWVLETLSQHPDYVEFGPSGFEPVHLTSEFMLQEIARQSQVGVQMGFDDLVFWFLPDSWKRVFHPRAIGHHIIANMILHEMTVERAKVLGLEPPQRTETNGPFRVQEQVLEL